MKTNRKLTTTLTASVLICATAIPSAHAATIPVDATTIGGAGCDMVEALANASLSAGGNAAMIASSRLTGAAPAPMTPMADINA